MRSRTWLQAGLLLVAGAEAGAGSWQLVAPMSFYANFPWVSMLPPYSEHLMRDTGALTLSTVVVLGAAAIVMERRLVVTALVSYLTFTVPHLIVHMTHLEHYSTAAATEQTVVLGLTVALPAGLLVLTWRRKWAAFAGRIPGEMAPVAGPSDPPAERRP